MPGRVPLLNSEVQSNVDLNNLTPQNIGAPTTRYKVKEVSGVYSYYLTAQDVNSVIKLTPAGGGGHIIVYLPDNIYTYPGEEIILWNTNGGFTLSPYGNVNVVTPSLDRYGGKPTKLTFLGISSPIAYYSFNNPGNI